jgi:hypothetical protein
MQFDSPSLKVSCNNFSHLIIKASARSHFVNVMSCPSFVSTSIVTGEGIGGRNTAKIIFKGSSRPRPWTSSSRRSNGGALGGRRRQDAGQVTCESQPAFRLLASGLYDARTVTNFLTKSSISKLT